MKLVERHIIKKNNSEWKTIDHLCFLSKNLYNYSVYKIREQFEKDGKFLNYNTLEKELRTTKNENYINLPNNSSQQILMVLEKNYISFYQALRSWKRDKTKFKGCPKPPKFKDKTKGRNLVIFTYTQVHINENGFIKFPKKTGLKPLKTKVEIDKLKQVRIIPQSSCYIIEVIYEKEVVKNENLNKELFLSIDLGVNNVASLTSNQPGFKPFLINGRIVKSINQYYNKKMGNIKSQLKKNHDKNWSHNLSKLQLKRNCKIDYYLHHVSKLIINTCILNNIQNIVIGKNDGWKQEIELGKRNNQNFVQIPFDKLIKQIQYKSELVGINVILNEESYTSKCSSLDLESIQKHENYVGNRIKRGLFKYSNGLINSDINGSLNILRKVIGDDFIKNLSNTGFVHNPVKVNPLQNKQLKF